MKVVSFLHVKPGKGGAFVRTRLKNVVTGQVMDVTFRSGERIDLVRLESKEMQFLYREGDAFVFMDLSTYEQIHVPAEIVGEEGQYVTEGMTVEVNSVGDEIIGVSPAVFVELEVTDTEPGMRGNTATGGTKPAVLQTGLIVTVPLFVNTGDVLKIDTRTREYVERVK